MRECHVLRRVVRYVHMYMLHVNTGTVNGRHRCIAITQPRTVAVTQLAARVAVEMNSVVGEEAGYTGE